MSPLMIALTLLAVFFVALIYFGQRYQNRDH